MPTKTSTLLWLFGFVVLCLILVSILNRQLYIFTVPIAIHSSFKYDNDANSSKTNLFLVKTSGTFVDRVHSFNVFISKLRNDSLTAQLSLPWVPPGPQVHVVNGAADDYVERLLNHTSVLMIGLPWVRDSSSTSWTSLNDSSNLLIQKYYQWTADDPLCTWIETPGKIRAKYDVMFNRTCYRNITETAIQRSLAATFINCKSIVPGFYWPNNGNAYPAHFHTSPPSVAFYLHIHRNAVVTSFGDVYSGNLKLALYSCNFDLNPTIPFNRKVTNVHVYDELFVISQYWGTGVFHRMVEIVPRLAIYLDFLKANPNIQILAPEGPGGRLGEVAGILGLNQSRLVTGTVAAKIVYHPRATACGHANVQECQILNKIYRNYIRQHLPVSTRSRVLLVRRSRSRRFTQQQAIENLVQKAATDYNLTYTLFPDNPTPNLRDTMVMFHSSVIVVAPVGAGESNILFSEPGTYIIEGVCNLPHVNFCFQRLANVLGMHWHGIPSRGGCEGVVDVDSASIDSALRSYLRMWKQSVT